MALPLILLILFVPIFSIHLATLDRDSMQRFVGLDNFFFLFHHAFWMVVEQWLMFGEHHVEGADGFFIANFVHTIPLKGQRNGGHADGPLGNPDGDEHDHLVLAVRPSCSLQLAVRRPAWVVPCRRPIGARFPVILVNVVGAPFVVHVAGAEIGARAGFEQRQSSGPTGVAAPGW